MDDKLRSHSRSRSREDKSKKSDSKSSSIVETETDPIILERRQKQIDYGKNGLAYDRYTAAVSKESRPYYMPRTPDKYVKYSRRQWDGLVKAWKLQIHAWDSGELKDPGAKKSDSPRKQNSKKQKKMKNEERSFEFDWSEEVEQDEAKGRKLVSSPSHEHDENHQKN